MEQAISILTEMIIKEHFENNSNIIKISKEDLMRFCIKLLKTIENYN